MIPRTRAQLMDLLREKLSTCVKCGACHAFCPVFHEQRCEGSGMRGKLALLQAWIAGRDFPPAELLSAISGSLDCFACRASCANAVDIPMILPVARLLLTPGMLDRWAAMAGSASVAEVAHKEPSHDVIVIATDPTGTDVSAQLSNALASMNCSAKNENSLQRSQAYSSKQVGHFSGEISHPIRRNLFSNSDISSQQSPPCPPIQVALPANDAINSSLTQDRVPSKETSASAGAPHQTRMDSPSSKERTFVAVDVPLSAVPCRFTFDPMLLDSWGRWLFSVFTDHSPENLVVSDPTWLFHLRLLETLYLFSDVEMNFAKRVMDLSGFLCTAPFEADRKIEGSWTWHDPCFAARTLGIKAQPRKLLSRLLKSPLVETAVEGACCGAKGDVDATIAPVGDRLLRQRIDQLSRPGITGVVTSCSICAKRLEGPLRERGIVLKTLAEFLVEAEAQGSCYSERSVQGVLKEDTP